MLTAQSEDVIIYILSFLDPPSIIPLSLVRVRRDSLDICPTPISVMYQVAPDLRSQDRLGKRLRSPCSCQRLPVYHCPSLILSDAAPEIKRPCSL
jgi:hypothetical protein